MYNNTTREAILTGLALCLVKINNSIIPRYVITHITVPCTYTPDWQCDAYCWHDEGSYDYNYDNAYVTYLEDFEEIRLFNDEKNHLIEGSGTITKLISVLEANLSEDIQ